MVFVVDGLILSEDDLVFPVCRFSGSWRTLTKIVVHRFAGNRPAVTRIGRVGDRDVAGMLTDVPRPLAGGGVALGSSQFCPFVTLSAALAVWSVTWQWLVAVTDEPSLMSMDPRLTKQ